MSLDLIIANSLPTGNGFTWTLASRLGHMLHRAEELFGARDASYTILGAEFSTSGPQLWYPGDRKHVVIQLNIESIGQPNQAYYQLAHETVHLLSPTGRRSANVLEEGIATFFAELYMREEFGVAFSPGMQSYSDACSKVLQLLQIDRCIVRNLRATHLNLHALTPEDLVKANNAVPSELAASLTLPFRR